MKMVIVTGGLKTGKSTFLKYLHKMGYYTISCDEIVKDVLFYLRIDKRFIIRYFFTNKLFRRVYLSVMIPIMLLIIVIRVIIAMILGNSLIFIEVPLFYEYKLTNICYTIVVWVSKEEQMRRIEKSGVSPEFLNMQLPIEYKMKRADYLVDNNGNKTELKKKAKLLRDDCLNVYQLLIVWLVIFLL